MRVLALALLATAWAGGAAAQSDEPPETGDSAAAMARKLQNPLATIKALMTESMIGFNTGDDRGTSFNFQLQPVYAVDLPDYGFTLIPRAVIPILGLEPGTDVPPVGDPVEGGRTSIWGLGDSVAQLYVAPYVSSRWKWGIGPQISFATATDRRLRGPGWGGGVAGVLVGSFTKQISFAGIAANLWSFENDFNTMLLQPMVFYNVPSVPGLSFSYAGSITADWAAPSRDTWTVPVGFGVSQAFPMPGGGGISVGLGPYYNAVRPRGAADWVLRIGIVALFP